MKNKVAKLLAIYFVLILISLSFFIQEVLSQSQKTFLWKVRSKTNTVYVLGSLPSF